MSKQCVACMHLDLVTTPEGRKSASGPSNASIFGVFLPFEGILYFTFGNQSYIVIYWVLYNLDSVIL